MQQQLLNHIHRHALFQRHDRILLAVSGGVDSMVLLNLLHALGYTIGVAHCNFQLRGVESDGDEALVRQICDAHAIPCHVQRFDTAGYADSHSLSTQMAARDLRYSFFADLCKKHGYTHVATAHHANDNLETVLLNLVRGTGLDGLTGIPVKNDAVVRPLLFATRHDILAYAQQNCLAWREDSSNASDYYHRNLIRNQVLPLLRTINPALDQGFTETVARLTGARALAANTLDTLRQQFINTTSNRIYINRKGILGQSWPDVTLWELIKHEGFSYIQCQGIVIHHQAGARFTTATHVLYIDRDQYIIQPREEADDIESITIAEGQQHASLPPLSLTLQTIPVTDFTLIRDPAIAQLDFDKLKFPLLWRPWQPGDTFAPLGMKQNKKLSDFLIDLRMPLPDKQNVTVLVSNDDIVWVTRLRISDAFKVTPQTKRVLIVKATSR